VVALVIAASPIWGFELLYRVYLPANRPQLPEATDATPLELDALWLEAGERPTSSDVTPLWALNYFRMYKPGADPRPGVHAVARVARLWAAQAWPPDARVDHLRRAVAEMAVIVWLSRTASADALKRALAADTYFGRHAYGIGRARRAYFGCSAAPLSTAQIALLVGIPQNPSRCDPVAHPDVAAKRRQYMVQALAASGVISADDAAKAASEKAEAAVAAKSAPCQ